MVQFEEMEVDGKKIAILVKTVTNEMARKIRKKIQNSSGKNVLKESTKNNRQPLKTEIVYRPSQVNTG